MPTEPVPDHLPTPVGGAASDEAPLRCDGGIPSALLDEDAVTVVRRLRRHGHEAYLVGGCVRDLLAGLEPKDFDVATDARPNRIKRIFRNARIIGRRFRLAHIHFGRDRVIETSTFRGPPERATEPDELPAEGGPDGQRRGGQSPENVFGTAPEDARRRDFTINALFYDPLGDEILDYVGGLDDMKARVVRCIGDPRERLVEDPVRILRAVHFAERMGFELEPSLEGAIEDLAPHLEEASQARLYIELLKVLGRGSAYRTLHRLHQLGALAAWTPEVAAWLEEPATWPEAEGGSHDEARDGEPEDIPGGHATWSLLAAADRWGPAAHDAEEALRLAPLLAPWIAGSWEGVPGRSFPSWSMHVDETLRPMALRMSIPRRTQGRLKELLWLWLQMRRPPVDKRSARLVRRSTFPLALAMLRLDLMARDHAQDLFQEWERVAEEHGGRTRPSPRQSEGGDRGGGRGGRSRKRGRRGGRHARQGSGGRRERAGGADVGTEAAAWSPAPPPPDAS